MHQPLWSIDNITYFHQIIVKSPNSIKENMCLDAAYVRFLSSHMKNKLKVTVLYFKKQKSMVVAYKYQITK